MHRGEVIKFSYPTFDIAGFRLDSVEIGSTTLYCENIKCSSVTIIHTFRFLFVNQLAKILHPDRGHNIPAAEEAFKGMCHSQQNFLPSTFPNL
jgi:hypothetical protein